MFYKKNIIPILFLCIFLLCCFIFINLKYNKKYQLFSVYDLYISNSNNVDNAENNDNKTQISNASSYSYKITYNKSGFYIQENRNNYMDIYDYLNSYIEKSYKDHFINNDNIIN